MQPLLTKKQAKQADLHAINELKIPEIVLMEHAAIAIVDRLAARFRPNLGATQGIVLAGTGNNGGDALAAARLLLERGVSKISVVLLGKEANLSKSAALHRNILLGLGVPLQTKLSSQALSRADWVIDGLFGTGLSRPVEGAALLAIESLNQVAGKKWIVAVDIPSGLDADTGQPLGAAVRASETVTLGFMKRGLVTGLAADHVGRLSLATIQIPREIPTLKFNTFLYGAEDAVLPERRPAGHKGDYGHVCVVAGPKNKQGAAGLSAIGSLRSGAGLTTVMGDPACLTTLRPRLPLEVMTSEWKETLFSSMGGKVLVVGPGLEVDGRGAKKLKAALESDCALVLDADALTLLAGDETNFRPLLKKRKNTATILTPHPKEASRLLPSSVEEIEKDRFAACASLADRWHATVVLKGKGTLIGVTGSPIVVVTVGNSGLSKGGTGDVLSGILAGLLAQGMKPTDAAALGVYLHGRACELFAESAGTERSVLASEVASFIPDVFREIESCKARK